MESNQNPENSKDQEYTPIDSDLLMTLKTSAEQKLKERERLQVAVIEEKVGKLAADLRNQFENALTSIKHDFDLKSQKIEMIEDEMRRDNQRLREELKQAQDKAQALQASLQKERESRMKMGEAIKEAMQKQWKRIQAVENRSLWDQIKEWWS